MNSWADISEHHLTANYAALDRIAGPDLPVLAVVKANAYGHSAELCAPPLARAGAPWLGVTDAAEGARVRQALSAAGIIPAHQPEILIMCGPAPEDADDLVQQRLTPTVWDPDQIDDLVEAASRSHPAEPLPIHLEIDSGMSRQGVAPGPALIRTLASLARAAPHLRLAGVLTHLSSAEVAAAPETRAQLTRFRAALANIAAAGHRPDWLHVGNTSTFDNGNLLPEPEPGSDPGTRPEPDPDATRTAFPTGNPDPFAWLRAPAVILGARPMLRSGLALYGHALPTFAPRLGPHLHPVLTWRTRIRSLTDIPAGAAVGYGATQHATRLTRLALLPVGYADGLRRELSSTDNTPAGWVTLRGQKAPVVGRISMNLTTVDVTDIPEAATGDVVTLLGPGITAEDHARLARTIPYEIFCGLRPDSRHLIRSVTDTTFAPAAITPVASP